ncbi:hypothetical protein [Intrasporangium calvum]|uniref:hypothetical protein n=1 Tax=Intrasporangium calvum TaxID=53358 RepID=UPI0012376C48|nr:hypothetical protein [Intrasporangium calvum]
MKGHATTTDWMHALATGEEVTIGLRRGWLVWISVVLGVFSALMGLGLLEGLVDGKLRLEGTTVLLVVLVGLVAWPGAVALLRLAEGGELRIDDTGLHSSVRPRFDVPWSAVLDVRLYAPSNTNAQVILDLDPEWTPVGRQTARLPRYPVNRLFLGRHAAYIPPVYAADAADLADFLGEELARRSSAGSFDERFFDRHGEAVVKIRALRMLPAVLLGAAGLALGVTGLWSRLVKADFSERPVATLVAASFVVAFGALLKWGLMRAMEAATVTVDQHGVRWGGRKPVDLPWSALYGVRLEARSRLSRVIVLDLGGRSVELPRGMGTRAHGLALLLDREILTRRFSGRRR